MEVLNNNQNLNFETISNIELHRQKDQNLLNIQRLI